MAAYTVHNNLYVLICVASEKGNDHVTLYKR